MNHGRSIAAARAASRALATVLVLLAGCNRTIEEDESRELVESRLAPCRQWCEAMLSPECGVRPEERHGRTVDECVEDCAAVEPGGWYWARQEDGTDACAEEWLVAARCIDALTSWSVELRRKAGSRWMTFEGSITRAP